MNTLARIWMEPREATRYLAQRDQRLAFITLVPLNGMAMSLRDFIKPDPGNGPLPASVIGVNVLVAALAALIVAYLESYPLAFFARRLGGRGSARQVRAVTAWSCLPWVPVVAIAVPLVLLGGDSPLFRPILGLFYVFAGVMAVWGLVIGLAGLSEVMALGIPKTLAVIVLSVMASISVFLVVMAIAFAVSRAIQS